MMGGNGYANLARPPEPPPQEEPKPERRQVHEPAPRYECLDEKLFYEAQKRKPGEDIEEWMERVKAAATAAGFVGTKRDMTGRRPAPSDRPKAPAQSWLPYRDDEREPGQEG
jgi:hypothetical protein